MDESRLAAALTLTATLVCMAGCGAKRVAPAADFPAPVVQPSPHRVALHLDPAFRSTTRTQRLPDDSEWQVDLGPAQSALFEQVLRGVFAQTVRVEGLDVEDVDGLLTPTLANFQVSTPELNQSKYYEAWLRYRVRLLDRDGREVETLEIKAYGRSADRLLGDDEALRAAVRDAMRDAAAVLVQRLQDQGRRARWLQTAAEEAKAAEETP